MRPLRKILKKGNITMNDDTQSGDVQFSCAACHIKVDQETKDSLTACRLCGKLHCSDCVDEFGNCVDCRYKAKTEKS
jgi:hypothetical protein